MLSRDPLSDRVQQLKTENDHLRNSVREKNDLIRDLRHGKKARA